MSTPRKPLTYTYDGLNRQLAGHAIEVNLDKGDEVYITFLTGDARGKGIWVQKHEIKLEGE